MGTVGSTVALGAYVAVLAVHFFYALFLMKRGISLAVGNVRSPFLILFFLLLVNGISLTVFVWQAKAWIIGNVAYHVLLTFDEIVRTRAVRARWPFIVNHVFFAAILATQAGRS